MAPGTPPRLVAIEPGTDGQAVLYTRGADGAVRSSQVKFQPWLLVGGGELAAALAAGEAQALSGGNPLDHLVRFPDTKEYGAALKSRGLEPFQLGYIRKMIDRLLHGRAGEVTALYDETRRKIEEHRLPLTRTGEIYTLSLTWAAFCCPRPGTRKRPCTR